MFSSSLLHCQILHREVAVALRAFSAFGFNRGNLLAAFWGDILLPDCVLKFLVRSVFLLHFPCTISNLGGPNVKHKVLVGNGAVIQGLYISSVCDLSLLQVTWEKKVPNVEPNELLRYAIRLSVSQCYLMGLRIRLLDLIGELLISISFNQKEFSWNSMRMLFDASLKCWE